MVSKWMTEIKKMPPRQTESHGFPWLQYITKKIILLLFFH